MYRDKDKMDKAKSEKHMLWDESISLAKNNGIGEVILTHFSPSLQIEPNDANILKSKLSNAVLGRDGLYRHLKYEDEVVIPEVEVENISKPKNKKAEIKKEDTNSRLHILKKYYKQMGMISVVEKVEKITSFKYRVSLSGGVIQNVFVYKSIQSMKENYQNMLEIDGFFVFVQKG